MKFELSTYTLATATYHISIEYDILIVEYHNKKLDVINTFNV